jgi:hypothetical protein
VQCAELVPRATASPLDTTRLVRPPAGADDHMITRFFFFELAEPLLVEASLDAGLRLQVVAITHLVCVGGHRTAAKGALHVPRAIAFLPKDVTSEERQLLRGGSSCGHLDEHGRISSRGFNFALHLVYASNTTRAMRGTEVRQAPGRFRCGITMEGALKSLRTSLTKII